MMNSPGISAIRLKKAGNSLGRRCDAESAEAGLAELTTVVTRHLR